MALLAGRTAIITGGAQGLGYAIAEVFVAEGARVVLGDLDPDRTREAAEALGGADIARAVRCDVTSATEVETLVAAAADGLLARGAWGWLAYKMLDLGDCKCCVAVWGRGGWRSWRS